jgi:hypothetical protein
MSVTLWIYSLLLFQETLSVKKFRPKIIQNVSRRALKKSSNKPSGCNIPYESWIGDGWCDFNYGYSAYNTAECDWDGGVKKNTFSPTHSIILKLALT